MLSNLTDASPPGKPGNPASIKKRLAQHARSVRKAYAGRLTKADALVFAYYVNCHKWALPRGDSSVHPGAGRIGRDLGLSRNQVKASRLKLIRLGLLRMIEAGGSLPGQPRRAMAVALGAAPEAKAKPAATEKAHAQIWPPASPAGPVPFDRIPPGDQVLRRGPSEGKVIDSDDLALGHWPQGGDEAEPAPGLTWAEIAAADQATLRHFLDAIAAEEQRSLLYERDGPAWAPIGYLPYETLGRLWREVRLAAIM